MKLRFHHTSELTRILIIAQFVLLSYLMYAVTLSVYKNHQIDRHIKLFYEKNAQLEEENLRIQQDIEYVRSTAYIRKIKKQNEGLVNPGEEVIVVPKVEEDEGLFDLSSQDIYKDTENSNPSVWWEFIFGV